MDFFTSARVWKTKSGTLVTGICHSEKITCMCCDVRDKYLVTGSEDKSCKVWDLTTGKLTQVYMYHLTCQTKLYTRTNTHIEIDVILLFFQFIDARVRYTFQVLVEHSTCVIKVTIKSDSTTVISGASDGCIMVWEVSSGECIHKLNTHTSCITTLMFLSNEQFVISCKIYYNSNYNLVIRFFNFF